VILQILCKTCRFMGITKEHEVFKCSKYWNKYIPQRTAYVAILRLRSRNLTNVQLLCFLYQQVQHGVFTQTANVLWVITHRDLSCRRMHRAYLRENTALKSMSEPCRMFMTPYNVHKTLNKTTNANSNEYRYLQNAFFVTSHVPLPLTFTYCVYNQLQYRYETA
jgi:hypothetical protein